MAYGTKKKRNVPLKLLKTWQRLRSYGDMDALVKETGKSEPVIYKALSVGYIYRPELREQITAYFARKAERLAKEGKPEDKLSDQEKQLIETANDNPKTSTDE